MVAASTSFAAYRSDNLGADPTSSAPSQGVSAQPQTRFYSIIDIHRIVKDIFAAFLCNLPNIAASYCIYRLMPLLDTVSGIDTLLCIVAYCIAHLVLYIWNILMVVGLSGGGLSDTSRNATWFFLIGSDIFPYAANFRYFSRV